MLQSLFLQVISDIQENYHDQVEYLLQHHSQDSYDYCEDLAKQHLQDIVERLVCPSGSQITEVRNVDLVCQHGFFFFNVERGKIKIITETKTTNTENSLTTVSRRVACV